MNYDYWASGNGMHIVAVANILMLAAAFLTSNTLILAVLLGSLAIGLLTMCAVGYILAMAVVGTVLLKRSIRRRLGIDFGIITKSAYAKAAVDADLQEAISKRWDVRYITLPIHWVIFWGKRKVS
jgi:membrane protein implicated in regulation of membrane protease activity